jgi:hypothetical protein
MGDQQKGRGGGSHKNQNGMLSPAGSEKKGYSKMNNAGKAMEQKQGGISKKRGEMHHKGNGQARHLGASSTRRAQVLQRWSGGRGHKPGNRRRSARAPAVSTGEVEPRR